VATEAISLVYPVAGGAGATLAARAVLQLARRYVIGTNETPPGRSRGGTAFLWTAFSWVVPIGVGLYTGSKLVRAKPSGSAGTVLQPAQS
jgi:hypothetical protein